MGKSRTEILAAQDLLRQAWIRVYLRTVENDLARGLRRARLALWYSFLADIGTIEVPHCVSPFFLRKSDS
jgi:hypothetical protein